MRSTFLSTICLLFLGTLVFSEEEDEVKPLNFVELGVGVGDVGEHGYCELCIYAVHQVQYGELPSCAGSSRPFSYDACTQVTQSMLAFAQDTMHLISYGCYSYDAYKGWQTVKPCPAIRSSKPCAPQTFIIDFHMLSVIVHLLCLILYSNMRCRSTKQREVRLVPLCRARVSLLTSLVLSVPQWVS